jgi:hypothetical protein
MNYTYRKMPAHLGEPDDPSMPHWCIVMVPDDDTATVTFMQNSEMKNLTVEAAERKVTELNAKLSH